MFRSTLAMMAFRTKAMTFFTRFCVHKLNCHSITARLNSGRKHHHAVAGSLWMQRERALSDGNRFSVCIHELSKYIQYSGSRNVWHSVQPRMFHMTKVVQHEHKPNRNCWNCGRDTSPVSELFFCDCGVVQKPATELTYFDLMQIDPSFDIDVKHLGDMFRETQKKLHPDKFSTKSEEERKLAQHQSALLNKAYNTLQKPLSRAIYLLELHNIEISEQDNFSEPEFLMEIMEINEEISSARKSSDVEALEAKNNDRIAQCIKEISELFKQKLLDDVKNATIKLRYFTTIQERVNELKRNSMDGNMRQ